MKNFKEEIEALKAQIDALENNLTCGCGCEDEGPEFDGAGFSEADRVVESDSFSMVVFSKEQLVIFAAKLMERTVKACKEAMGEVELDPDYCSSLELSCNNQIEVDLDNRAIVDAMEDAIDCTIELDNDTVEVEVIDILKKMDL